MNCLSSHRRSVLVWLLAAGLLSACSGGGGGSGTPTGQALTGAYYPDAQQNTWTYDGTSTPALSYFDTISVTGTKSVLGHNTSIFLEDNPLGSGAPVEDYYLKDSRAFTNYGNNDPTDWLTAALVPYDEMLFGVPLTNLTLFNKTGVSIGQDLDGDGISETVDARAAVNFNQFERLVTTAGVFSSAGKATATANITVRLSKGGTIPTVLTIAQWRAPDIGLLKEITTTTLNGTVVGTDILDIHGYRVNGVGAGYLAPKTLVSGIATASSDGTNPGRQAVGTDGTNFLLVSRQQDTNPSLAKWTGRIVLPDGTVQTPFDLATPDSSTAGEAAVAFDGTNYLVLTNTNAPSYSGITGQFLTATGSPVNTPLPFTLANSFNPAVAYGGGVYLIVYVSTTPPSNVYGVIVDPSSGPGSPFPVTTTTGTDVQSHPSVAFDGTNFLVAWEHWQGASFPATSDIVGARVGTAGGTPPASFQISTAVEAQNYPQVACDGTNCLVIWTDRRNYPGQPYNVSPGPGDIYGTRIAAGDLLLDGMSDTGGLPIATGITANQGYPGLAYNGTEYIVAWSRGAFVNNPGGPTGIYGAHVATNGTITLGPTSTGVAISGPPAAATQLFYVSMAGSAKGTLATWLNNIETSGTTKSISGALMYPLATQ
ncbi:MAG: hypothetical protein WCA09_02235 [Burkholderiales bacterium]